MKTKSTFGTIYANVMAAGKKTDREIAKKGRIAEKKIKRVDRKVRSGK